MLYFSHTLNTWMRQVYGGWQRVSPEQARDFFDAGCRVSTLSDH
jgi:hypothetical protein